MTVANAEQFLMVLGGPGIGKSTFLRKIGLEALKRNGALKQECIPVFLELKKFREETIDIHQKIVEEFEICRFPVAEAFVTSALEQGKLLVLFDGLDEVPSQKINQVIEKIEDFVDKHSQKPVEPEKQNSFVASCRTAAYRSSFRRFTDVTISEFDDEQIKQFIERWFSTEEDKKLDTAKKYFDLLNQNDHKATKELAQTPLLLTFLCLVYDREQLLPSKRSTLYGKALNIILSEWSAQKRLDRDPIYEGFNPEIEKELLAEIAYESFKKDQLFFSREMILEHISAFLADTLDNPKYLDAEAVLNAIEVQQGILVERATDAYSFSHLTLQEYLTAQYIVENRLQKNLVENHIIDKRWREVFLLVAGLTKNPVPLLLAAMEQKSRNFVEPHSRIQNLINWAAVNKLGTSELHQRATMIAIASNIDKARANARDRVTYFNSAIDSAIDSARAIARARARAIAIDSAIDSTRAIAHNIDSAIAIDSAITRDSAIAIARARAIARGNAIAIARGSAIASARVIGSARTSDSDSSHHYLSANAFADLAEKLSRHEKKIPDWKASSDAWCVWADQLDNIWINAFGISLEDITFSKEEAEALSKYLFTIELLLHCKQSAIRVSRKAWENLEAKLLAWDEVN